MPSDVSAIEYFGLLLTDSMAVTGNKGDSVCII